ncbi:MAG: PepSY domain-containing protein [Saprospiraceae bacterium]|nr:PepSY domain-containing protein [Saprospiraceae bacterium]
MANAAKQRQTSNTFRVLHRYLGFFLVGIMAVYATSGIIMIFRDTDFLKEEEQITKNIQPWAADEQLGQLLGMRQLKIEKTEGDLVYFGNGTYNKSTGEAQLTIKELPEFLRKMTELHKARSAQPLFFLNLFFGISLLFFVISAFWMFIPSTSVFKKGMYFTLAGIVLTLILLFLK